MGEAALPAEYAGHLARCSGNDRYPYNAWRRGVAGLHAIVQTAFGWSGEHLHRFVIGGTEYGISYLAGPGFRDDARQVRLAGLGLREGERFAYEYNFFAAWRVDLRVEQIACAQPGRVYPRCTGGRRAWPARRLGWPVGPHPRPQRPARRRLPPLVPRLQPGPGSRDARSVASPTLSRSPYYAVGILQDAVHGLRVTPETITADFAGSYRQASSLGMSGSASTSRISSSSRALSASALARSASRWDSSCRATVG